MGNGNHRTVLAAVVGLAMIAAGLVAGVAVTGRINADSTPLITAVLVMIGTVLPAILALSRVEHVKRELENGLIERKVENALNRTVVPDLLATPNNSTAMPGEQTGDLDQPGVYPPAREVGD